MKLRELVLLILVAALSAAGTVAVSYALKPDDGTGTPMARSTPTSGIVRLLDLSAASASALAPLEAAYQADRARLEQALASERETLASLLEDPSTSEARLHEQVDRVVAAGGALEQRTAEFLIAVRPLLTPEQQRKLFDRFAAGVREAGGYRWRYGHGQDSGGQRGGGLPAGRGPGRGRGHTGAPAAPATQPRQP